MEAKTFDEGIPRYVEAIRKAYQEEGDIEKAREKVQDLRRHILSLPSRCGINRLFRLAQAENKVVEGQTVEAATIQVAEVVGESHD